MYGTATEAAALVDDLKGARLAGVNDRDVLIAPPFPPWPRFAIRIQKTRFLLAAQEPPLGRPWGLHR